MAVQNSTQLLRSQLQASVTDAARSSALEALREILTEENTDALIHIITDKISLPIWLRWIPLGSILDRLLPEKLLQVFEEVLG